MPSVQKNNGQIYLMKKYRYLPLIKVWYCIAVEQSKQTKSYEIVFSFQSI